MNQTNMNQMTMEHLYADLELPTIIAAMAEGNHYIEDAIHTLIQNPPFDAESILKRQEVLKDCIAQEAEIRRFYALICDAVQKDKDAIFQVSKKKAKYMLGLSSDVLLQVIPLLKDINRQTNKLQKESHSTRFDEITTYVNEYWNDQRLTTMERHLKKLRDTDDFWVITSPGSHMRPEVYTLTTDVVSGKGLLGLLTKGGKNSKSFDVNETDEEASAALTALKNAALTDTSGLIVAVKEHTYAYLKKLKEEFAFYIGCLNLKKTLDKLGIPLTYPSFSAEYGRLYFEELSNVSLTLQEQKATVRNSINCDDKPLITVTGSNQGGKTTWLRAIGQAIIMAHLGMFVTASSFNITIGRLFTHFIREEDRNLKSGKLDEELVRMSEIIAEIKPGDCLIMNESFSSTNEEEGSGIAMEIIQALLDKQIRVIYVTHFYRFIQMTKEHDIPVLYLNAERREDGVRTYQLIIKEPTVHGHSDDLYGEIFG